MTFVKALMLVSDEPLLSGQSLLREYLLFVLGWLLNRVFCSWRIYLKIICVCLCVCVVDTNDIEHECEIYV